MVVGLGVDLFAPIEAECRKADPVFTRQLFTHDNIVARARASVAPESSP